jgi:uncharacterized protein YndB with AHSA1/START domain
MTTSPATERRAADYTATFTTENPPEAVFDALTTTQGLAAWWTPVSGDGTKGGELRFHMQSPLGPLVIRVHTAQPSRLVVWDVVSCPFVPDWDATTIAFDLGRDDHGGSDVFFRHHGLTAELECFAMCRQGWDHFLPSLRQYVDTGTGNPRGSAADQARRAAPGSLDPGV